MSRGVTQTVLPNGLVAFLFYQVEPCGGETHAHPKRGGVWNKSLPSEVVDAWILHGELPDVTETDDDLPDITHPLPPGAMLQ